MPKGVQATPKTVQGSDWAVAVSIAMYWVALRAATDKPELRAQEGNARPTETRHPEAPTVMAGTPTLEVEAVAGCRPERRAMVVPEAPIPEVEETQAAATAEVADITTVVVAAPAAVAATAAVPAVLRMDVPAAAAAPLMEEPTKPIRQVSG